MKKTILFLGLSLCFIGSAMAQNAMYDKTKKLKPSEVPVTVMKAFVKDFQNNVKTEDGTWSVVFVQNPDQGKLSKRFEPVSYSFTSHKRGSEKVEIKYSPEGKLKSVHGIADPTSGAPSGE